MSATKNRLLLLGLAFAAPLCAQAQEPRYLIGTYYFPGWTSQAKGLEFPEPWKPIQKYPEKQPKLGWYSDSDPQVLRQQIQWMRDHGIGFVAFDWYWDGHNSYLEQALNAFRASKTEGQMKFSLLWANHYPFPGGLPQFRLMVRYWVARYFSDPDFLTIDGQPVVFIFSIDFVVDAAKTIGVTPTTLIKIANDIAKESGLPGIYFVGGTPALEYWANGVAPTIGMSALSAYNYHFGYNGTAKSETSGGRGFARLASAYRQNWQWLLGKGTLPYIVPMTVGWDKRPWGGSSNPEHDNAIASAAEFEAHLREAKSLMDAYPAKTKRMGVICCWNEFGEGSYIEPTKKDGLVYLETIKKVFAHHD
ncbi:MAG: hypothetical protein HEQ39_05195 [Rhizobacter sp.]